MLRQTIAGAALAVAVLVACPFAWAGDSADATDANIVTALDISDSVAAADAKAQIAALAAAVRAPEFLEAVGRGANGRVALAVFVWHHYRYEVLPWTVIGSLADAEAAARQIEMRISVNVDREARMTAVPFIGRLTDISRALDHAAQLLADMRSASGRGVVNVLGNGRDNIGEPAGPARRRLLDTGATVNGVVLDAGTEVAAYYRAEVAGGPGAFVMTLDGPESLAEVMLLKLIQDLVVAAQ